MSKNNISPAGNVGSRRRRGGNLMDAPLKKELKRYKREIKHCLLCDTKQTKRFLTDFSASIDLFIAEQNAAEIETIRNHFGQPDQIAKAFFAQADINEIRKKIRTKRLLAGFLIAIVVLWGVFVGWAALDSIISNHGHGEEELIVFGEGEVVTEAPDEIIIQGESA